MSTIECVTKTTVYLPILSAFGGAVITGIFLFLNNKSNIDSNEKKHHRELMLKTALEHWKQSSNIAIEATKLSGKGVAIDPLVSFIINLLVFSESFSSKEITKHNECVRKIKRNI